MDLDAFVRDGYAAVRGAVDAGTVAACRELIWAAMERRGVRRDDPGSWPPLVQGMDDLAGEPLLAAYTAPTLTAAYDGVGGEWLCRTWSGHQWVYLWELVLGDAGDRGTCGASPPPAFSPPEGKIG